MKFEIIRISDKGIIVKYFEGFLVSCLFFALFISSAYGLKSPAYAYCEALGFTNFINTTNQGETDYCQISSSLSVDAWKFLQGKVAQEFSYCKKMGYDIKTARDIITCERLATEECAVCIFPNKTEVEVTKLMNLDLREGKCGDGKCVIGENYFNCLQDCPSGSIDIVCDKVKDGICDPDCVRLNMKDQDPDCLEATTTTSRPTCGNNVCEIGETISNCPQDCVVTTSTQPKPSIVGIPFYVYIIIIVIIIAIIILFIKKLRVQTA